MWVLDLIGSLGLFLLGMWLMTEGLRLAGGQALQALLGRWTSSRKRALAAGILVTALVQSSSAVTVAAIGFVNAGLMAFQQSMWVIFGSNVGTTLTAWLVTLFGFSVDIDAFTFPLFGIGALMRVFLPWKRGQALGMSLAGFGLLFMGIDALQESFAGAAERLDLTAFSGLGLSGALLGLAVGLILTVVTQSSSAAIAMILTAVAGGLVELNVAIAAVVGANIGTTSTALIATIGATANARRLAFAHVIFNLITGVVALALIPVFLALALNFMNLQSTTNLTLVLAVFHTSFNLLGVILMLPVEPWLSRKLLGMFDKPKPDRHPKSTLDKNVAAVPDLAMRALALELGELKEEIGKTNLERLVEKKEFEYPLEGEESEKKQLESLEQRLDGVDQFISLISQADLTKELSARLTAGFSASHYLRYGYDTLVGIAGQRGKVDDMDNHVYALLDGWLREVSGFAAEISHTDNEYQATHWAELLRMYQSFKQEVLSAAVNRGADMGSVEVALFIGSLSRRYVEQLLQVKEGYAQLLDSRDQLQAVAQEPEGKVQAQESGSAGTGTGTGEEIGLETSAGSGSSVAEDSRASDDAHGPESAEEKTI